MINTKTHIVDCDIDGELVKFKCEYWSKDIIVEMISPYLGKRKALHILYMIPTKFDETNWKENALKLVKSILEENKGPSEFERTFIIK
jgi:hypothetical protein